jgi:hypothetical protein
MLRSILGGLIAAIGAALASLAFVAAVGGGVLLARYTGAGLPSEAAVALLPKSELVAVGGEVLAFFVAFGALVVLLFAAIEFRLPDDERHRAWGAHRALLVVLGLLGFWAYLRFGAHVTRNSAVVFTHRGAAARLTSVVVGGLIVFGIWAAWSLSALRRAYHEHKLKDRARPCSITGRIGWYLLLFSLILVTGAAGVIGGALVNPLVRPVAMSFVKGPEGMCGLFVVQTSDRIFIAVAQGQTLDENRGFRPLGQLRSVRRDGIDQVAIGSDQSLDSARKRAFKLLVQVAPHGTIRPPERKC